MPDSPIDYGDVQGTILRGYRVDLARHFFLSVTDVTAARAFIGALAAGTGGLPRVTTAEHWTVKPECFVNIAFTAAGLLALGVTAGQLKTFDKAFRRGATDRETLERIGDTGTSAPAHWIGGLGDGAAVHVLLSVWVKEKRDVLERVTASLRAAFAGIRELGSHDASALPDNQVHFGYRDNIAQPTVRGAPPRKHHIPDDQEVLATGEFLLGYESENGGTPKVTPQELSKNSSYAAFRILEQDVVGFESFLATHAKEAGISPELLAAKVCGRWRNGNPLTLDPDAPGEPRPDASINKFSYNKTDLLGLRCPVGSHIRRNNPRDEIVDGAGARIHRIVRRAMPYGPLYDPAAPPEADPPPRGLIGYFINASIFTQFEFISKQWNLGSEFVASAKDPQHPEYGDAYFNISGQDVFLGVNNPASSSFTLAAPGEGGSNNTKVKGFPRVVHTRGSAYVFFPSITGLRYLATGR